MVCTMETNTCSLRFIAKFPFINHTAMRRNDKAMQILPHYAVNEYTHIHTRVNQEPAATKKLTKKLAKEAYKCHFYLTAKTRTSL